MNITNGENIMIELNKIQSELPMLSLQRDVKKLSEYKTFLTTQREKLDRWFDKYLDMFDKDMKPDNGTTAVWNMYRKKYREYNEIDSCLKSTEYFLSKAVNV